jgi:hypothetical protein
MLKTIEESAETGPVVARETSQPITETETAVDTFDEEAFARDIEAFLGDHPSPGRIADAEKIRYVAFAHGVSFPQAIAIHQERTEQAWARIDPTPAPNGLLDYAAVGLVSVLGVVVAVGLILFAVLGGAVFVGLLGH